MVRILLVEDDRELNRTVCSFLNQNGFEATGTLGAEEAYDVMADKMFDLIISDIMMPEIDGFEFAKTVRRLNQDIPILMMSARDDFMAKQRGYRIGIDDYLVKPVDLDEMLLKIGAILRRYRISNERQLVIGELMLNTEERSVVYKNNEIPLTVREFNILMKLLANPRKTFTRSQLMDEFWSADTGSSSRTVDVYMAKIREKFSECNEFEIVTVHGLGYKAVIHNE